MEFVYKTTNTCSKEIHFDIENDIITNVRFLGGGCPGNLQALPRLVEGFTVAKINEMLGGIMCGRRNTSCANELAKAVVKASKKIQVKG